MTEVDIVGLRQKTVEIDPGLWPDRQHPAKFKLRACSGLLGSRNSRGRFNAVSGGFGRLGWSLFERKTHRQSLTTTVQTMSAVPGSTTKNVGNEERNNKPGI